MEGHLFFCRCFKEFIGVDSNSICKPFKVHCLMMVTIFERVVVVSTSHLEELIYFHSITEESSLPIRYHFKQR